MMLFFLWEETLSICNPSIGESIFLFDEENDSSFRNKYTKKEKKDFSARVVLSVQLPLHNP